MLGGHQELVDQAYETHQREVERDGGIRTHHALDRGVRDVALVPEQEVSSAGVTQARAPAGEAGEVFRQHRVPTVWPRQATMDAELSNGLLGRGAAGPAANINCQSRIID